MVSEVFEKDVNANNLRPTKRLWWVMFFLRLEQRCKSRLLMRGCAAFKKMFLSGTCCELPACALVGGGLNIPHLNGIVVTPYATVGSDCRIFQQVTIGVDDFKDHFKGAQIGNRVFIGAGAKVIGPINIGNDVKIGANAIVTKDVPDGVTVVGANRHIIKD